MRVGIDAAPLVQTQAGTARWIRGLMGGLEGHPEIEVVPLAWGGPGRLVAAARDVAWYPGLLPLAAARRRLDALHCTIFRGPLVSKVPAIVTVHDLAVLRHPDAFPAWTRLYARTLLRPTVRAARRVIAVSEFSRRETAALCDVDPDRIDVVPNGVDAVFRREGPAEAGDYLLAVGTLEPRKNLPRVVEAAERLGMELRVVGASGWGGVAVGGPHVRWLGRIPDEELAALYRGAACVVYPSLYEGFGIPVAEALACGAPVVTSAGSAMAEVAGDAAVLVDPLDPEAIAAGVAEAMARGDALRSAGLERAAAYTWERAADADVLGRHRTGDETYVRSLLHELPGPAADAGLRIAAVTRHPQLVPDGIEPLRLETASQELRMAWSLPRLLRRSGAALVHTQYAIPLACPCPAVVTIHDLSFERDAGLMGRRDRLVFRRVVPRAARRAARVLAVSERTCRDLVELYGLAPERIAVTPNGVDPRFAPGEGEAGGGGYVLAVGAVQARKNQLAVLAAARALGRPLVVAGPVKDDALADELARGGARLTGYVSDRELLELYRGAACLVQASRYEGFGLPVLEAMASGTPVVAVPEPALLEVAGEAAVIVEEDRLSEGIERAIAERDRLVAAGIARAALFSWRATAEATVRVYREALALRA